MPSLTEFETDPDVSWRPTLTIALDLLQRLGAVERSTSTDPAELAKLAEITGVRDPEPTFVRYMPIALWAMNRLLRDEGVTAPVVGELAGESLAKLCEHLAASSPEAVETELDAWVTHRSPSTAAEEAAEFLRRTEKPSERLFALIALGVTGEPGLTAAQGVHAEGGIPGAVTAAWLVHRGVVQAETLTAEEMRVGMTDHLSAMNELGMLHLELESLDDPAAAVAAIAHADHPDRLTLLDVIAQDYPDPKVAKRARKARFALRSGR
jgi:hypothetical protein